MLAITIDDVQKYNRTCEKIRSLPFVLNAVVLFIYCDADLEYEVNEAELMFMARQIFNDNSVRQTRH